MKVKENKLVNDHAKQKKTIDRLYYSEMDNKKAKNEKMTKLKEEEFKQFLEKYTFSPKVNYNSNFDKRKFLKIEDKLLNDGKNNDEKRMLKSIRHNLQTMEKYFLSNKDVKNSLKSLKNKKIPNFFKDKTKEQLITTCSNDNENLPTKMDSVCNTETDIFKLTCGSESYNHLSRISKNIFLCKNKLKNLFIKSVDQESQNHIGLRSIENEYFFLQKLHLNKKINRLEDLSTNQTLSLSNKEKNINDYNTSYHNNGTIKHEIINVTDKNHIIIQDPNINSCPSSKETIDTGNTKINYLKQSLKPLLFANNILIDKNKFGKHDIPSLKAKINNKCGYKEKDIKQFTQRDSNKDRDILKRCKEKLNLFISDDSYKVKKNISKSFLNSRFLKNKSKNVFHYLYKNAEIQRLNKQLYIAEALKSREEFSPVLGKKYKHNDRIKFFDYLVKSKRNVSNTDEIKSKSTPDIMHHIQRLKPIFSELVQTALINGSSAEKSTFILSNEDLMSKINSRRKYLINYEIFKEKFEKSTEKEGNLLNNEISIIKKENIHKFKFKLLREIFEVIRNKYENLDEIKESEISDNLKNKLIIPCCCLMKKRNLDFNFPNFYVTAKDVMNLYI